MTVVVIFLFPVVKGLVETIFPRALTGATGDDFRADVGVVEVVAGFLADVSGVLLLLLASRFDNGIKKSLNYSIQENDRQINNCE